MKRTLIAILAGFAMASAAVPAHAQQVKKLPCKHDCGLHLGQNEALLDLTRLSNAGGGNGGEVLKKPSKKITETGDLDPGRSGLHNEAAGDDGGDDDDEGPVCKFLICL